MLFGSDKTSFLAGKTIHTENSTGRTHIPSNKSFPRSQS